MSVVKGENTDLFINGHKVHIQTEDWGSAKQVLISRVFKNGVVCKTVKLAYQQIPNCEVLKEREKALKQLHQSVIDWSYSLN